jgi:monoterpene epsilon-lactone hydrolase
VLYSPFADVACPGDTMTTLADAEPFLVHDLHIRNSALACADAADHQNPYVSPAYGDYTKGFPPTLIQVGVREFLLSDIVRLHGAIDTADQEVKLDPYEGMPHVFQALPHLPEAKIALGKVGSFLRQRLAA